jgi:hypothetical protein
VKFLFVTYCMGSAYGEILIGVYKRGLRVALELSGRGHQVFFFCTGRQNFHDSQTALAEQKMEFVEIPFQPAKYEAAEKNRAVYLAWMRQHRPDVVVIGEAPMAGTMLEATLAAAEAHIPTVMLDNAYHPAFVDDFLRMHGPVFDGVILTGPSALQGPTGYRYLAQVPPLIEVSQAKTQRLLDDLGLDRRRLLLLLAYDPRVEHLGLSLMERLDDPALSALFISGNGARVLGRLNDLQPGVAERIRVIAPPQDDVLFGLIQAAGCAVTKCAFMQVTESLSLHTPVIGLFYPGGFSLDIFPRNIRAFSHMTSHVDADPETVKAARRFLNMDRGQLKAVHDGTLAAAARAADFLESMPPTPRADTTAEVTRLGFTMADIENAIGQLENHTSPRINQVRSAYLRKFPDHDLHELLCDYSLNGTRRVARLWGRIYRRRWDLYAERRRAGLAGSRRRLLTSSLWRNTLLEMDLGEEVLPSIRQLLELKERQP